MADLAIKLNQLMNQKKYNAVNLEKATGISRNTIYSILSGHSKNPGAQTLQLIAKALDVSLESLLTNNQPAEFKPLTIDQVKIFGDTVQIITNIVIQQSLKLSIETLHLLINEAYQYSIQITPPAVDERFVKWMIHKYCKP